MSEQRSIRIGDIVSWQQYPGVAFRVDEYVNEEKYYRLAMHMVGDDRRFEATFYGDLDEVWLLAPSEYCEGCGQMGCGHGGGVVDE